MITHSQGEPGREHRCRRSASVLAAFLALILLANTLVSCGPSPAMAAFPAAADTSHTPAVASALARPSPTLPPALTVQQTVPAAALPSRVQITPTGAVTASPEPTTTSRPTSTGSPEPTATSTVTPTATGIPTAMPSPTLWTSTPALSPSPVPTTALTEKVLTILLIGGDRDYVLDMNTDALIVAVVNRDTKQRLANSPWPMPNRLPATTTAW